MQNMETTDKYEYILRKRNDKSLNSNELNTKPQIALLGYQSIRKCLKNLTLRLD